MRTINQDEAVAEMPLIDQEHARLWRAERYHALECLSATFKTHEYTRHTHDSYVLGIIERGCETYFCRGAQHYAGVGDFCIINPGEVHDGAVHGEAGYSYRMIYPSVPFICELAEDVFGKPVSSIPFFTAPQVTAPELALEFYETHLALERADDRFETDERMVAIIGKLLARHAVAGTAPLVGRERTAVARAREHIDDAFAEDVSLADLASLGRMSRHHLIRAFKNEIGLTPHAYLTDRRVREARRLLGQGYVPAEVAAACGFYDQSHLNRVFKARVGVTPGAFPRLTRHS
jgi:AraC-like DNA-binding protein